MRDLPRTTLPAPLRRDRGNIVVLTLVVSMIVILTLAAAVQNATTHARDAQYSLDHTAALAAAEGTTEAAQKRILVEIANFRPPPLTGTVTLEGLDHRYVAEPIGDSTVRTSPEGLNMVIQKYRITCTATFGSAVTTVERLVDLTMTPLFQFLIFYNNDLEILPGPPMTIAGRVHSNADIYVGASRSLQVDSAYFRNTGDILRKRKNDNSESLGQVTFKVAGTSDTYASMSTSDDSERPDWIDHALTTWGGAVLSGAHGVREMATPAVGTIKAFDPATGEKGYYHQNADLVVVNGQCFDRSGNALTMPPGTVTEKTMYDAREGKMVKVTDINVGLLNTSGHFPENGLIYAYRTDARVQHPNGIRLSNGKEIVRPMTLVTEDPLYLKGDFNTVNQKGVAVMSDAVNLLSNAWDDSKRPNKLPLASPTQWNVAMVTGNVPTPDGGGPYSGGFENLPRFHERWTGVKATIRGAFVNIFESEIARSKWVYGEDVYFPPDRDWKYDTRLDDMDYQPPFTPSAVHFQRVLWDDKLPLPLD